MTSEQQYLNRLQQILKLGEQSENRTGVDTVRILGTQDRYDLNEGFPLFTTKRTWFKAIKIELLWFLSGDSNIKFMVDNGVNIWTDDAYRVYTQKVKQAGMQKPLTKEEFIKHIRDPEDGPQDTRMAPYQLGEMGPVYGVQWRKWGQQLPGEGIDQIAELIYNLKTNPNSRRHILSAWNVDEIDAMGLPPCHVMSQWTVENGRLTCHMYQRSCDMFLGVPFNVASYSLLTHMIAQVCGLGVGEFIHTMHDCHIYLTHLDQVRELLSRDLRPLPQLQLNSEVLKIDDFTADDIKIINYNPHPTIKAELITSDIRA